MKKLLYVLSSTALIGLYSCNNSTEAHQIEVKDAVVTEEKEPNTDNAYQVNLNETKIEWTGSKPIGSSHHGTINLKSGHLSVDDNNQISGGEFIIDMNSITNTDLSDPDKKNKLESHLKSEDFFDVNKYPEAKFVITGVKAIDKGSETKYASATHLISGNLTMKAQTKNVEIPAVVNIANGTLDATSEVSIDRTLWNVNYNSDASLKDKFINKEIVLKLNLKATK